MPWTLETYSSKEGVAPLEAFYETLSDEQSAQLLALFRLLGERGNTLRRPHSGALGQGLFELRTKSGVRVFYIFRPGKRIVLLDGIVKKRDDIPSDVLKRVRAIAKSVP